MAVQKKGSLIKLLFVLIIITCIIIAVAILWKSGSDTIHGDFESSKKVAAEVLYSDVSNQDIDKNYPKTPDEVMQLYGKCYKLLYGDMIRNDDIFANVLQIQRGLFSDELAQSNLFETQLEKIKNDVENLKNEKVFVVDFEAKPPIYSKDFNSCDVRAIVSTNVNNDDKSVFKAYLVYNIIKDENEKWKIQSFRNTDSTFN